MPTTLTKTVTKNIIKKLINIADKLSDTNKKQLDSLNVAWVELRSTNGYTKFQQILTNLNIPHTQLEEDINKKLNTIFDEIF